MNIETERARLNEAFRAAGKVMAAFPRDYMGLATDAVKATTEYRAAKRARDDAFEALRAFNKKHKPTKGLRYLEANQP